MPLIRLDQDHASDLSLPYRLAMYYSNNPEELENFFEQDEAITIFGTFFDMLKSEAKKIAKGIHIYLLSAVSNF